MIEEFKIIVKNGESMFTKQQAFLRKLILASHIIYELCDEPTFGHTKLMKLLYLSEQVEGMALRTNYKKFATGPFDGKTLTLIDLEYQKNEWFEIVLLLAIKNERQLFTEKLKNHCFTKSISIITLKRKPK